MNTNLF